MQEPRVEPADSNDGERPGRAARERPAGAVQPPRVAFASIGCKANREEMDCLRSRLADAGWEVVPFGSAAEWVVVNTCTVTAEGDADSRQAIRRAARASGGGNLIVTGCLAQRAPQALAAISGVTAVLGNAEKAGLCEWIQARAASSSEPSRAVGIEVSEDPTVRSFPGHGRSRAGGRERRALKVQDGCDARCTYCVIPAVRGASRSRPLEDCRRQAGRLADRGGRELVLTGINLSLWGADLPGRPELPDLVEALAGVPGIARLRLSSIEPQALTPEWLERFLGCRSLCRHFHLPLQSGDADILRRMGRPYDPELFAQRVRAIRRAAPDAAIGADVMVGFPGESDEAFERTERMLAALPLSYLHVFSYSPRPGGASLRYGPPPPRGVVRARSRRLRDLSGRLRERFARSQLGSEAEASPERRTGDGRWEGTTGNYLRVRFPWKETDPWPAGPVRVRLRAIRADGRIEADPLAPGSAPAAAFGPDRASEFPG